MKILIIFPERYAQLIHDEDELINAVLFNGLYPQSIEFLKHIQKINVNLNRIRETADSIVAGQSRNRKVSQLQHRQPRKNEVQGTIQYRLLLCIIMILSKHKNAIPQNLLPQTESDSSFYKTLMIQVSSDRNIASSDEKGIENAI